MLSEWHAVVVAVVVVLTAEEVVIANVVVVLVRVAFDEGEVVVAAVLNVAAGVALVVVTNNDVVVVFGVPSALSRPRLMLAQISCPRVQADAADVVVVSGALVVTVTETVELVDINVVVFGLPSEFRRPRLILAQMSCPRVQGDVVDEA